MALRCRDIQTQSRWVAVDPIHHTNNQTCPQVSTLTTEDGQALQHGNGSQRLEATQMFQPLFSSWYVATWGGVAPHYGCYWCTTGTTLRLLLCTGALVRHSGCKRRCTTCSSMAQTSCCSRNGYGWQVVRSSLRSVAFPNSRCVASAVYPHNTIASLIDLYGCYYLLCLCGNKQLLTVAYYSLLQVYFLHVVPGQKTSEFAQPTAVSARGFAFSPLNRISWWLADRMVLQGLYHKLAVEVRC